MLQKRMKQIGKKTVTYLSVLAMLMAGIQTNALTAKADESDILLSFETGEKTVAAVAGNVDVNFSGTGDYQSISELVSAGYKQMSVEYAVSGVVSQAYPGAQTFVSSSANGGSTWDWAANDWNNIGEGGYALNTAITKTGTAQLDFSSLSSSTAKLGNFGVQFAGFTGDVTYQITDAKLIYTGVGGSSSGTGGVAPGEIGNDVVALTFRNPSKSANWIEYSFSVTNKTSEPINGINVLIPTSGAIGDVKSFGNWSAAYDASVHGVVAYLSQTLLPGQTIAGNDDDKFGMNITNITVSDPYVMEINCKKPSTGPDGAELNYELTGQTKTIPFAQTPVGKHGKLSVQTVEGYKTPIIVDENGTPFQLRGTSTHGIQWDVGYNYINEGAFQSLRDEWGVNMIRLACYVTQDGYTMGAGTAMDTRIQNAVSIAETLGMYVLIDWHVHSTGGNANPHDHISDAKKFFDKYSQMYKDKANVLFEICNEPVGIDWYTNGSSDLYAYCKEITKLIRDNGSDNLVICGTNTWSQRVDQVADKPLTYDNVLYTLHFYASEGSHKDGLRAILRIAVQNGTPVFVTEFGICSADGNGTFDIDSANAWIQLLDENNISYCCWQISNKAEASSYLKSSCSKKEGGWVSDDLATTGVWLVNTYRAHQDAEEENEVAPSETPSVRPSTTPSAKPSQVPSEVPSETPSVVPSEMPSEVPSVVPSEIPSEVPSVVPSKMPSASPSVVQSQTPGSTDEEVKAESIKLTAKVKGAGKVSIAKTYQLAVKKSMKLNVTISPADVTNKSVTYISQNPKIATVSSSGKVVAKRAGKTKITIAAADGIQKSFTLKVMKKAVKKLQVQGPKTLKVKNKAKLKVALSPSKMISKKVLYKSSSKKIATVSTKGVVKAKKKGTVKITVYALDGSGKKGTIKITCK